MSESVANARSPSSCAQLEVVVDLAVVGDPVAVAVASSAGRPSRRSMIASRRCAKPTWPRSCSQMALAVGPAVREQLVDPRKRRPEREPARARAHHRADAAHTGTPTRSYTGLPEPPPRRRAHWGPVLSRVAQSGEGRLGGATVRRVARNVPRLVTAAGITGIVGGVGLVALATLSPAESRAGRDPARAVADRPVNTERPLVRGNVVIGRTVRTTRGRWRGGARLSYVFRWSRCDHRGGSCSIVTGATGRVHVVGAADVGRSLRSVVVATNAIGRATAVSSPTPVAVRPGSRIRGIAIDRLGAQWSSGSGYERYAYLVVGRGRARDAALHPGDSLVYHSGTSVNTEWDSGARTPSRGPTAGFSGTPPARC